MKQLKFVKSHDFVTFAVLIYQQKAVDRWSCMTRLHVSCTIILRHNYNFGNTSKQHFSHSPSARISSATSSNFYRQSR